MVLSTMLHGIGVGNMLPSWVKMVCVDINPSVVTKLVDRGSAQTMGVVTDTGLFVHQLARKLRMNWLIGGASRIDELEIGSAPARLSLAHELTNSLWCSCTKPGTSGIFARFWSALGHPIWEPTP